MCFMTYLLKQIAQNVFDSIAVAVRVAHFDPLGTIAYARKLLGLNSWAPPKASLLVCIAC